MEKFPSPKRSTRNRLHNNLGNNLTLLYYYYFLNFININFSQIQTKTLWENWLNLISFCNLSESAFFWDVLSHQMLLSYRISTPPLPPWGGGGAGLLQELEVHFKTGSLIPGSRWRKVCIYSFLEFKDCFNEGVSRDEEPDKALPSVLSINTLLNLKQANPHRKV